MVAEEEIFNGVAKLWRRAEKELGFKRLTANEYLTSILGAYKLAIGETAEVMKALGIWDECAKCGRSLKGSCCAPEVASWYDLETLIINILMGCTFPSSPFYKGHCLFLGEKGCLLKARHYYCVHFLCPEIQNNLTTDQKETLMKVIGKELLLGSKVISCLVLLMR